ncbi:MAG: pyruvate kinase [Blastochloris viridis]|uniref:Pyruvate kinase n=1 Tax=Blastochloris viridis TaxID=1079 RepID=A0A6N4R715_BLAVI|nr:MAG: pyruvate kinase [Blastochloris viridis]
MTTTSPTRRMAKILATLGPSSNSEAQIRALVDAGANAFRLNFSHGMAADHAIRAGAVRNVAKATGKRLPILADLQGPKIRIGEVTEAVHLQNGATLVLDNNPAPGDATRVCLPHPAIMATLQVGDTIMVNDGVIQLKVTATDDDKVTTTVVAGGMFSSRKGVNVPGRTLPMSALTGKDKDDLKSALEIGVDWIALSFVQTAQDVRECKELVQGRAKVMAKIETRAAIDNLADILAEADGLMVARGDLGVELPTEDVPPLQKEMIDMARKAGKPIVVATQMLESMITNPRPTRAEANDVANAAYDGADCVMLSAESASGQYPVDAVSVMARIIVKAEQSALWRTGLDAKAPTCQKNQADAVAIAATKMAETIGAKAMVAFTESGSSIQRLSRLRALPDLIALTPYEKVARQVEFNWGVQGLVCPPVTDPEDMVAKAREQARAAGLVKDGDMMVVVAGIPFGQSGSTNMVRVVSA